VTNVNPKTDFYKKLKIKNWFSNNETFLTVIRRAGEYGIRSYFAKKQDERAYFESSGSYEDQWLHLWFLLNSWNKKERSYCESNAHYFFKKYKHRSRELQVPEYKHNLQFVVEKGFEIKYCNKPNRGYNITKAHLDPTEGVSGRYGDVYKRIDSAFPGKFGEFKGAERRKPQTLFSWWNYLLTPLLKQAQSAFQERKLGLAKQKEFYLVFRLKSVNSLFLRYFFLLQRYISLWPFEFPLITIEYNFKKFNLIKKKKRYIKKYKRRVILTADRAARMPILLFPQKTVRR
jgi:hypothetical protein